MYTEDQQKLAEIPVRNDTSYFKRVISSSVKLVTAQVLVNVKIKGNCIREINFRKSFMLLNFIKYHDI